MDRIDFTTNHLVTGAASHPSLPVPPGCSERFERYEEVTVNGDGDNIPMGLASVVVRIVEDDSGKLVRTDLITAKVYDENTDKDVYFDDAMIEAAWSRDLVNSVLAPIEREIETW